MLLNAPAPSPWNPNPTAVNPAIPVPVLPGASPAVPASVPALPPASPGLPSYLPPESTKGTQFVSGEANNLTPAAIKQNAIDFTVDSTLPCRKLYAYLWTNPSDATDYFVRAVIEFWKGSSKVGSLPLAECVSKAAASIVKESIATVCVSGGNVVDDSLGLFLSAPTGTQPNSVVLQPHYIRAEIDRITVSVLGLGNMTDLRIWLGVISSDEGY